MCFIFDNSFIYNKKLIIYYGLDRIELGLKK